MRTKILSGLFLAATSITAHADIAAATINQSHMLITLFSFFGVGILLAFTPCVLPMVPILSAILIGQEQKDSKRAFRLSLVFVLSMAVTYAFAGILAGYLGSTLQTIVQQPWIIISFSSLFVVMALAMFGCFNLTLPSSLQTKLHNANNVLKSGSYVGVAAMGILSTLIASPCVTAPLLSVLTFISQTGSATQGGLILFTLALGMGVPLILFGMGQSAILPKAGMWMNNIKNVFGIMILGLAIWMLSRIIPANITLYLWAALFIIGAISLGALNFTTEKRLPPVLHGTSMLALIYGMLLLAGAANGNENAFHPLRNTALVSTAVDTVRTPSSLFTYVDNMTALEKKIHDAKISHQPVMIEFFATWCPDCKKVDEDVLSSTEVQQNMKPFSRLRVDVSNRNAELSKMMEKYNVMGVPTMVFFNKDGKLFDAEHLKDGVTKESLLATLKQLS